MGSVPKSENTQWFGLLFKQHIAYRVTMLSEMLRHVSNYPFNVLGFHMSCNNEFHFPQICTHTPTHD